MRIATGSAGDERGAMPAHDRASSPRPAAAPQSSDPAPAVSPPSISLPKGGGAIRGMGEKFATNPVTGTGTLSIPVATSPGRSGLGPQLALMYDSGAGNGPFGLGWTMSLPAISRKTEKGLPRYRDAEDSDDFILAGVEDLVPVEDGAGKLWDRPRRLHGVDYRVRRYRPRVEGQFPRIERWTRVATGEAHWRSITSDNVTSYYGRDVESKIFDPADPSPQAPTDVFSWLLCEVHDDRGNVVRYRYRRETEEGVDLRQAHERSRSGRGANRYPDRITYGNRTPYLPEMGEEGAATPLPDDTDWLFEVVFDYGDRAADEPTRWLARGRCARTRSPPTARGSRSAPTGSAAGCSCSTTSPTSRASSPTSRASAATAWCGPPI